MVTFTSLEPPLLSVPHYEPTPDCLLVVKITIFHCQADSRSQKHNPPTKDVLFGVGEKGPPHLIIKFP